MSPTPVSAPGLWVEEKSEPAFGVVLARGELDLAGAPALCAAIARAGASARRPRVLVDLRAVEFCDSTGLRALTEATREIEALAGRAVLAVTPDGPLDRMLELTGAREFLLVADSLEAAQRLLEERAHAR